MKASEVLRLLRVTRQTLSKYVKDGTISVDVKPNGQYDYNAEDVFNLISPTFKRQSFLYLKDFEDFPKDDFNMVLIDNPDSRNKYAQLIDEILQFHVKKLTIEEKQYSNDELFLLKNICKRCGVKLIYKR